MARAVASEQLWPNAPDEVGRANLRRALWQLPRGWVSTAGNDLVLEAESDIGEAHHAAARALHGEPLTLAEIELLSNDILPGWHEDWVLPAQEAFRLLRVQALEMAYRTMTAGSNFALATQAGAAALSAEPLRESAAEALISAHLGQRNRHEAAQCFRSLEQRLRVELGVAPDPSLTKRLVSIGLARRNPV